MVFRLHYGSKLIAVVSSLGTHRRCLPLLCTAPVRSIPFGNKSSSVLQTRFALCHKPRPIFGCEDFLRWQLCQGVSLYSGIRMDSGLSIAATRSLAPAPHCEITLTARANAIFAG